MKEIDLFPMGESQNQSDFKDFEDVNVRGSDIKMLPD